MNSYDDDDVENGAGVRWICLLLAFISLALVAGRIMSIQSKERKTPFFSANDRSRWCTICSLGEFGTYEIDRIIKRKSWDTIDKVCHEGRDGELHFYSSKPPLFPTMLAGKYWLIKNTLGASIRTQTYYVVRLMLMTTNVLPLLLYFWLIIKLTEELSETAWGRVFVVAAACFGTFLTTFAVSLNNHLPAAICVLLAIFAVTRIQRQEDPHWIWFVVAGLAASFTAVNELPALSFLACLSLVVLFYSPKLTMIAYVPAVAVVAVGFFGTNYVAHESFKPPYAHRSTSDKSEGVTSTADNWYDYEGSYWNGEKQGVDRGEPSKIAYGFNATFGHYGIFSLTPIWLLSLIGIGIWFRRTDVDLRWLAGLTLLLMVVCLTFYIGLRPMKDRNYGGVSCGFRWMFWFIPMWTIMLIPVADWLSEGKWRRAIAIVCLSVSVFSATYGAANPWVSPWIYEYWKSIGWIGV